MHRIRIKEVDFHAAHYLPSNYGKCNNLHGHTYTFRNIVLYTKTVVDFSVIKAVLTEADHKILVPEVEDDNRFWYMAGRQLDCPCIISIYLIPGAETTVETIAEHFKKRLLGITGIEKVSFTLCETKNCGADGW